MWAVIGVAPCLSGQQGCTVEDEDGDEWTVEEGDCNDTDASSYPGAPQGCDDIDHDCDGSIDADMDGDGLSAASCGGSDCNDADAAARYCSSCLGVLQAGASTGDGVYMLEPCGDGQVRGFYCDMTQEGGGWTVAGWQNADAKTNLGVSDRGEMGAAEWSSSLSCIPYSEIMVFNDTYGQAFRQTYDAAVWSATETNMSIGSPGTAFNQGTYGPSDSQIMMGCVDYAYNGESSPQYGCDNDSQKGQKGHISDYAGEYCSGGRLDYSWAWTDGTTCNYRGMLYVWGFAIR